MILGRTLLVLALVAGGLAQCGRKPPLPLLPPAPVKAGPEIRLDTQAVPLNGADPTQGSVGRFVYAGGLAVTSPDTSRLHGLSDLKINAEGALLAVTDDGDLFEARLVLDDAGRLAGLTAGKLSPLRDPQGQPLQGKARGDAEGLAVLANGDRLVSFERDHRIWLYPAAADGSFGPPRPVNKPATTFPDNEGMEALTAYPAAGPDAYLVGGEEGETWLCRISTPCQTLPAQSPPDFTWGLTAFANFEGASIATVHRTVDPLKGWRNQVRFVLDPRAPAGRQFLAAHLTLDGPLTRDNFEGVALSRTPSGATRLYLLSDDNAALGQRTLLLAFDWTAPPPPPPAPAKPVKRRR